MWISSTDWFTNWEEQWRHVAGCLSAGGEQRQVSGRRRDQPVRSKPLEKLAGKRPSPTGHQPVYRSPSRHLAIC
ncbi:hypothetical protein EYF80_008180 [Liparis tanakae]|uniref:Uncharacterized protein n=1 Tax=Liparis tanakae TaxID=230148 RepID=A0A4Z2IW01_9TELE|nr:hypothetical protein EYF80_008180 [Liparis tanakae]